MPNDLMNTTNHENEFVIFLIGDKEYCIDIMSLKEIRGWTTATLLPNSPSFMKGVINLRGAVVPIIDLAIRLGLPPTKQSERSIVMITTIDGKSIGLFADAVLDIMAIPPEDIQIPPNISSQASVSLISGLIAREDRMISVINLPSISPDVDAMAAA